MSGAVTAPYDHQLALDHVHRQLENAGVPNQMIIDIFIDQPDNIRVPPDVTKEYAKFLN